jgi:undecaprenyl diphosphate synthase/tritrans,polycis-undecaprenyl-diphosphate synthase [geranylgeranyl-diphosphate specific]
MLKHIALIPDGNRRYAKKAGLSLEEAYALAAAKVTDFVRWCIEDLHARTVTVYMLSRDNVRMRSAEEVRPIYDAQVNVYNSWAAGEFFHRNRIRVKFAGDISTLPDFYQDAIKKVEDATRGYADHNLYILAAYSGRHDIVQAAKKAHESSGELEQFLMVPEPVDALVRTANEKRLSDFLPLQSAYAELFFLEKLFPEISREDVALVGGEFERIRQRKFGG